MNYVFIHGGNVSSNTWNAEVGFEQYPPDELLGGKVWSPVVSILAKSGFRCYCPTLLNENRYSLSDHIEQIVNLIISSGLDDIKLIAHSYGGMVLTGVISKLYDRVSHAYYIDAAVPEQGESLFDLLEQAGFTTSSVIEGRPKAYVEKYQFSLNHIDEINKTYISCSQSMFSPLVKIIVDRISDQPRWNHVELNSSHLPMAHVPDELASILIKT